MSCGRDQWQQNAHGPNSLNYVTTRSNGPESLRSSARSSTHLDFKRLPQNEMWTKHFCDSEVFFEDLAWKTNLQEKLLKEEEKQWVSKQKEKKHSWKEEIEESKIFFVIFPKTKRHFFFFPKTKRDQKRRLTKENQEK